MGVTMWEQVGSSGEDILSVSVGAEAIKPPQEKHLLDYTAESCRATGREAARPPGNPAAPGDTQCSLSLRAVTGSHFLLLLCQPISSTLSAS